jgi:hypothetical protein
VNESGIQRDVTEQVEQIILVHGTISAHLSLDEFATGNLLVG